MPNPYNQETIIKRFQSVHGTEKYDYSKFIYTSYWTKSVVICNKHNFEFLVNIKNHIKYGGCPKCGIENLSKSKTYSQQQVIDKFIKAHGNKYDYSLVKYVGCVDKVDIICKEHGIFSQRPSDHFLGHGCPTCKHGMLGKLKKSNTEEFIYKATVKHNGKYDYSLVEYKGSYHRVKIICKEHGVFLQKPNVHLMNHGCPTCSLDNIGWSVTNFYNSCKNKRAILYVIKCFDDNETFYKIGITGRSVKLRFVGNVLPYKYEILHQTNGHPFDIYYQEKDIHKKFKEWSYVPIIQFYGNTECYREIDMDYITKYD